MADHSQRALIRSGLKAMLLAALIALGLGVAAWLGWFDSSVTGAAPRPIQDQGSSLYCLFAVNGYLTGSNMWDLEAEYWRRGFPNPPTNTTIWPLLNKKMTWAPQWRYELAATQLKYGSVAASGHNHAIVLLSWQNGKIRYLDPLHAEKVLTMTDQEFWAWSDGWYWWVVEESVND